MNSITRFCAVASLVSACFALPPSRISEPLNNGRTFTLPGNIHPRTKIAADLGTVSSSLTLNQITLHLQRSASQQKQLDQLIADQQNPASPSYHKFLTPEQFSERFGTSPKDLAKVKTWLEEQGFQNVQTARTGTFLTMNGTAAQAQTAFYMTIHKFQTETGVRYANVTDPILPHALQGMVSGISGLNNFKVKPHAALKVHPRLTSGITGNHYLTPNDFATIYGLNSLYSQGIDGTGEKIAIPGQTDIDLTQVAAFRAAAGLSVNPPQVVVNGTDPGNQTDDQSEAYLDVEWAGGIARNATVIYVASEDVFDSVTYIIDHNTAPVMSITYGLCESQYGSAQATSENALFQTANAEGMTITAASGDTGAADCENPSTTPNPTTTTPNPAVATTGLAVDFPASSPYVTGIGGTEFNEGTGTYWSSTNDSGGGSALSYIPEQVWNDTAADGQLAAGGGGKSVLFTKPSWQTGDNVPSDGARDVPDIALNASINVDEYITCADDGSNQTQEDCTNGFRAADETFDVVGGTSAGAPSFGGVVVLLNQAYGSAQGNVNPRLYQLASSTSAVFHDVTTGNNEVPCQAGSTDCPASGELGYVATQGYDLASGLGSIDGANLVSEWASSFTLAATPNTLTLAAGGSGTSTLQVTTQRGFSGTVSLTCTVSSVLTNTTCSIPSSVAAPGSVTVTLSNSSTARVMPVWRTGPGSFTAFTYTAFGSGLLLLFGAWILMPKRRLPLAISGCAYLGLVLVACGGGSSSSTTANTTAPPASVTGTVTITGTNAGNTQTTTITVTQD